jgi:hypothetical protein
LDEIIMRFASAAVSPCDVMGQRQTALNDYFALTSVPDRPRLKGVQVAEHLRHLCVLDFSLSHRTLLPLLLITRLGLNLMKRVYPGYGQPKPIPAVTSSGPRAGSRRRAE